MVKKCSYVYPKSNEEEYKHYYEKYPYELHDFQKWCVEGIVTGNHVLICCPTGSGKTFGGEFSINYFHSKGKKVIYTSPIKALSNEKFHAFTQKYPTIKVGLITGDIRCNPDADVLIMTTEILLNKLYQVKSNSQHIQSSVSFEMDIENELGCVVFDEIHMINDEHRGNVWEQCIMMLPRQIQMVGLSATLDNPEKFASWLETKGNTEENDDKNVYLTRKLIRAVPLIHYTFITVPSGFHKKIKDKATQEEIKKHIDKPFILQTEKDVFNELQYQTVNKMIQLFHKHDIRVKRQYVLNKVSQYLVEHDMLPALCYVFSRKQLEICAQELTTNLLEFDSKIPYTVDRECEQIIRKLPNYEEYLHLPEYVNTVKLLRKGVGIHHAGMMPILREMIELLFARGFVKILFCTETMSVGINLPVKTTIFTDVNKYNGEINRMLYSHEYTQAAGRAGRLGLDNVGHVIHLNNLFRNMDSVQYKIMMNNKPQTLLSKFKISYNLLLNLIDVGDNNLVKFASKSMITDNLEFQLSELNIKINTLNSELENTNKYILNMRTPIPVITEYIDIDKHITGFVNKKRKEMNRKLQTIRDEYKFIEHEKLIYLKFLEKGKELVKMQDQYNILKEYFSMGVGNVLGILREDKFIENSNNIVNLDTTELISLTNQGKIACQIREVHCLVFANMYNNPSFLNLSSRQMISLFSCFTNIKVIEELKDYSPKSDTDIVNNLIHDIVIMYAKYYNIEVERNIQSGIDYSIIHYDLLNYMEEWCDAMEVDDCKLILQKMNQEKNIFLGEFVKAILKINNISCEFEKIAEMTGNVELLSKLKEIPELTLKFVVTNQSLYV
jgi:superfamily II RNA helicase